jgi:hypothetical protein
MYRGKYHKRIESLDHDLGTAMGKTVHRRQHHTKAMEKRNTDTKLVL